MADVSRLGDLEAALRKVDEDIRQKDLLRSKIDLDGLGSEGEGEADFDGAALRLRERIESCAVRVKLAGGLGKSLLALSDEMLAFRAELFGKRTTDQLDAVAHKRDVLHHVKIEPPAYRYVINDKYGKAAPVERSTGERNLLALSFAHAARSVSGRHLPVIVEAPLRVLDDVHKRAVVSHILARATGQMILLILPGEVPQPLSGELQRRIAQRFLIQADPEGAMEARTIVEVPSDG